jgi:NAD(P)-dependent dehydrogenase (short-subunit alcohol dehydrogenase family)/2-polyprenyl-6-methoxyphenol hydroxylase-like FAD-dependent oxidoreductase
VNEHPTVADRRHDVLVVGAGPAGLLLALDLRRAGVDVAIIDTRTQARPESRATSLNARTMQILHTRGLLSSLGEVPRRSLGHFAGLEVRLDAGGPFAGVWNCPQNHLEGVLIEALDEAGVSVGWGTCLTGLDEVGAEVRAEIQTSSGRSELLRAGYLVGCDGEDSIVRRLAGIELEGRAGQRRMLRADVDGVDLLPRRFDVLPHGMATAVRTPSGTTRVMAYRHGARLDDPGKVDFDEICSTWQELTGEDLSGGDAVWVDAFTDAAQWAARFRRGRILLAGDSGHLFMPAGGTPLNIGLDDAARLAWRLAAVHRRGASDAVLTRYSDDAVARAAAAAIHVAAQAHLLLSENDVEPQRRLMAEMLRLGSVHDEVAGALSGLGSTADTTQWVGRVVAGFELTGERPGRLIETLSTGRPVLWIREDAAHRVPSTGTAYDYVTHVGEPLGHGIDAMATLRSALILPDGEIAWTDQHGTTLSEALFDLWGNTVGSTAEVPSAMRDTLVKHQPLPGQRLSGKRCLVTGASRGIGRGIALDLAREGAVVAVHCGRRIDQAREVVAQIQSQGGAAFAVVADFDDLEAVHGLIADTTAELAKRGWQPQIDVLVNNAGVMGGAPIEDTNETAFDDLMRVNVKVPFFLTQQVLGVMPTGGRVINISSGLTKVANPNEIAYAMTKGAVEQLTKHLAKGVAERGITVNAVAPGITDNGSELFSDPSALAMMSSLSPFGRVGEPAEIAAAVTFLASDAAGWITGSIIDASGGTVLG